MSGSYFLIGALASMLISSLALAAFLFWMGAAPVWVITGGTIGGIIVYVVALVFCAPLFVVDTEAEGRENA